MIHGGVGWEERARGSTLWGSTLWGSTLWGSEGERARARERERQGQHSPGLQETFERNGVTLKVKALKYEPNTRNVSGAEPLSNSSVLMRSHSINMNWIRCQQSYSLQLVIITRVARNIKADPQIVDFFDVISVKSRWWVAVAGKKRKR